MSTAHSKQPAYQQCIAESVVQRDLTLELCLRLRNAVLCRQEEALQSHGLRVSRRESQTLVQRAQGFLAPPKTEFQLRHPFPGKTKLRLVRRRFSCRIESLAQPVARLFVIRFRQPFAGRGRRFEWRQSFKLNGGHEPSNCRRA